MDENRSLLERTVERSAQRAIGQDANAQSGLQKGAGFSPWALLVLALGGLATLFWALALAQFAFHVVQWLIASILG